MTGIDVQGPFDLAMYFGRMMYVPQPGAFFTRKALEAVGGWRGEFSYTADADFWFRIALRFPVRKLNRVMARYRYHPLQRDRQRALISRDWEKMIRDLIANEPLDGRTLRYARSGIFLARHRYADSGNGGRVRRPSTVRSASILKRSPIPVFQNMSFCPDESQYGSNYRGRSVHSALDQEAHD